MYFVKEKRKQSSWFLAKDQQKIKLTLFVFDIVQEYTLPYMEDKCHYLYS